MAIRITFTIILLLYSFESLLSQSTNFEQPPLTVKKIQTEFIELASKYLEVSISNRDSASKLNDKMISKLLELYDIDSTNRIIGMYLVDCYSTKNDFRQVIRWSNHALKYATDYKPNVARYNESIGYAYIRLGQLDSAKIHFQISFRQLKLQPTSYDIHQFFESLFNAADSIYQGKDTITIRNLKTLRKEACTYYLQIWEFIMPYAEKYMDKYFLTQRNREKSIRLSGCR